MKQKKGFVRQRQFSRAHPHPGVTQQACVREIGVNFSTLYTPHGFVVFVCVWACVYYTAMLSTTRSTAAVDRAAFPLLSSYILSYACVGRFRKG